MVLVKVSGGFELLKVGLVDGFALGLEIGAMQAADFRAFIPLETQPTKAIENDLHGFLSISCFVGVLDA